MRRAMRLASLCIAAVAMLSFGRVEGQLTPSSLKETTVPVIDAIGMIDRTGAPRFKVGTWVKYDAKGSSESGDVLDYELLVTVGGEELFWGEECFWLETATSPRGETPITIATLMSYALFDKSVPPGLVSYYQRKTIMEQDDEGNPIQTILKRASNSYLTKEKAEGFTRLVDTLGTETITTPKGTFTCLKVREESGLGSTSELGDSTRAVEQREVRTTYHTREVPITGLARTDIEVKLLARTWKVGQSSEVPMLEVDHASSRSELVDFGEGREGEVTPKAFRRPIQRSTGARKTARK